MRGIAAGAPSRWRVENVRSRAARPGRLRPAARRSRRRRSSTTCSTSSGRSSGLSAGEDLQKLGSDHRSPSPPPGRRSRCPAASLVRSLQRPAVRRPARPLIGRVGGRAQSGDLTKVENFRPGRAARQASSSSSAVSMPSRSIRSRICGPFLLEERGAARRPQAFGRAFARRTCRRRAGRGSARRPGIADRPWRRSAGWRPARRRTRAPRGACRLRGSVRR